MQVDHCDGGGGWLAGTNVEIGLIIERLGDPACGAA